jgi:hypothetical protein
MAKISITLDYAAMEEAAKEYDVAAQVCLDMSQQIQQASENLSQTAFHGGTGNNALKVGQGLMRRLSEQQKRAEEMAKDIRSNIGQMRDTTDPGTAQKFTT